MNEKEFVTELIQFMKIFMESKDYRNDYLDEKRLYEGLKIFDKYVKNIKIDFDLGVIWTDVTIQSLTFNPFEKQDLIYLKNLGWKLYNPTKKFTEISREKYSFCLELNKHEE